ncbi:hypothetical protein [Metabacillus malikii]|uniref:DUF4306 domain-containing protein n=1 Tax=Metabacillus malikii TaxID=1504265 RepID=A0ABT9ZLX6_9BACI|nr:hypothetical protein [Metabacillus malikii]MDQ0233273.1 hypothetical protein [Metabacillus malikii]
MNRISFTKIKKLLTFIPIIALIICISYLIVYKASILPNGYEVIDRQEESISIKSYNLLGFEKNESTVTFSDEDTWKISEIVYNVDRQKETYWLLYSAVSVSIVLFVYKVRQGTNLWHAIFGSNIIFTVLIALILAYQTIRGIQDLIS